MKNMRTKGEEICLSVYEGMLECTKVNSVVCGKKIKEAKFVGS